MNINLVLRRFIYWLLCIILVIFLFVAIFGGTGFMFSGRNLYEKLFFGLFIGFLGLVIAILGVYKPLWLLSKTAGRNHTSTYINKRAIAIWQLAIGLLILFGGIMYSFIGVSGTLLLYFCIPVLLSSIFLRKYGS